MTNLFRCFDSDEDGHLEKMEFLDGVEMVKGFIEGGKAQLDMKERKAGVTWFKQVERWDYMGLRHENKLKFDSSLESYLPDL